MDILKGLNSRQKEAVETTEGRIRVVAGAGAGKTKVLTNRYVYLVEKLGMSPANILCMTFTNKAAQEMKSRIRMSLTNDLANDYICTIHSLCIKILRKEIFRIGFPKSFTVLDDEDSIKMMKQVMEEKKVDREEITAQQLMSDISEAKKDFSYIEYFMPEYEFPKDTSITERYFQLQLKYYALDFEDIVNFTLFILDNYPEAAEFWENEFDYIQVDEVQDCSDRDWKLIDAISKRSNNLFIVGDADQAIYEWRGAKPEYFVNFKSDKDIILDQNYRSTQSILDVSNCVIKNNTMRIEKNMFTENATGKLPMHVHSKDEESEARFLVDTVSKSKRNYDDFAILYRASSQSRAIEQALMKAKIPYTMYGGIRFFDRKEIKDCLAYLKLISNNNDDLAFKRVINTPSRKFGAQKMKELDYQSNLEDLSYFETLKKLKGTSCFKGEKIEEFVKLIDELSSLKDKIKISDLFNEVLIKSRITETYREETDEERLENISELMNSIKYYEESNEHENLTLEKYIQDISLFTNMDYKKDNSGVRLMTIHQSKGLEFPVVFIVGLTEGMFPSHRSIRERKQEGLEEERRLFYVASTRAKEELYMLESEGFCGATKSSKFPSRFLIEIDDDLKIVKGSISKDLLAGAKSYMNSTDRENSISTGNKSDKAIGSLVNHKVFGVGVVVETNEERKSCKVQFPNSVKNIQWDFLEFI